MTTARDIMHAGATCIGERETLDAAAQHMRDLGVGALPICGDDTPARNDHRPRHRRQMPCRRVDPATTTVGQLAQGNTYHVDAEADIQEMLNVMEEHQVRRLPVIDDHRLVGIVSEADIARHLPEHAIVQFVKAICAPQAIPSH